MMSRYKKAKQTYDKPVMIVTQEEAEANEKTTTTKTKTWKFSAKNVRDYGFTASKKYIWDMMAVKVGDRDVMAVPLSQRRKSTLGGMVNSCSCTNLKQFQDIPLITLTTRQFRCMQKPRDEYPMICWNYGRPEEDGTYVIASNLG